MAKPTGGKFYVPYQETYINKVNSDTVTDIVKDYSAQIATFYNALPEAKADHAYAPEKWTIKDVIQHVIDAERIFAYRLLRIARKDKTPLPGFEENDYAVTAGASARTLSSLKEEFNAVRTSTDLLLLSLTEAQLDCTGFTSGVEVTANTIAYVLYGHLLHHKEILEQRYL